MSENKGVTVIGLEDAKEIVRTISNKTSQSIIEYLKVNKGATSTQIAKALKIPASTVHYNISALVKAKILDDDSFHYSSKGKEVSHYEVSDRVIVIVPNSDKPGLGTQLKTLLPGILGLVAIGGVWFASKVFTNLNMGSAAYSLDKSSKLLANQAVYEAMPRAANTCISSPEPNTAAFIFGGIVIAIVAIVVGVLLYNLIMRKGKACEKTIKK